MGPWWRFADRLTWSFITVVVIYSLLVIDQYYLLPALAGSVWLVWRMLWRLGWQTRDIEQMLPSIAGGLLSAIALIWLDAEQGGYLPPVLTVLAGVIVPRWWLTKVARRSFTLRNRVDVTVEGYDSGWLMIESGLPRLDLALQASVPEVHWRLDRSMLANEQWRQALARLGVPTNKVWPMVLRIDGDQLHLVWAPQWIYQSLPDAVFEKANSEDDK